MTTLASTQVLEPLSGFAGDHEVEESLPLRGKKAKPKAKVKPPTKVERQEVLRERIKHLAADLDVAGFGSLLRNPAELKPIAPETSDVKTGGYIAHIEEELGSYIQRVSIIENFYQRQPFDHLNDKIYLRLIRDFILKAAMPEAKVAALDGRGGRLRSLKEKNVKYSLIDGLERLYCYCISVLLVWQRDKLIADRCITNEAWDYLKDAIERSGDPSRAVEEILRRKTRYEIFWNIDLEGLLHYMVTYNTGQRRMSLEVQLEIMQRPLLQALEHDAKIPIFQDNQNILGKQKPKNEFSASDLVMATRAFIEFNPQIKKPDEAETLLERERGYTDIQSSFDVGDIRDVVATLKKITIELHPKLMEKYANNPNYKYILSGGGVFLLGFAAACGKVRNMLNMTSLEGAFERLSRELDKSDDDPLNLEEYQRVLASIKTSRGKAVRRLVYDTFLRFFNMTTPTLDWTDTARQISI